MKTYTALAYIAIICLFLQNSYAEEDSRNCFVDSDNFISSNRRAKRVFCNSADFKSPIFTCIDKMSGKQIKSSCKNDFVCQDVSEVNSNISKLRCVEKQS